MLAFDGVAVGFHHLGAGLHHRGNLRRVDAGKGVRILGDDVDAAGEVLHHLLHLRFLPGKHLDQLILLGILERQAALHVATPLQVHPLRAGLVALLGHQGGEFVLLHGHVQAHHLAGLHVGPGADDEFRVLLQQVLRDWHHSSFRFMRFQVSWGIIGQVDLGEHREIAAAEEQISTSNLTQTY